jgi:predicted HD phosphohydrolase
LHVAAKRYKACKIPRYVQNHLTPVSCHTLELQGGPMSYEEAKHFERHPYYQAALRVRAYSDAAKVKHHKCWSLHEVLKYVGLSPAPSEHTSSE